MTKLSASWRGLRIHVRIGGPSGVAASCAPAAADVERVEVLERTLVADGKSFGNVALYEQLREQLYFAVGATSPENQGITDIRLAPRDARGNVHFAADFLLLHPIDPARGKQVCGQAGQPYRQHGAGSHRFADGLLHGRSKPRRPGAGRRFVPPERRKKYLPSNHRYAWRKPAPIWRLSVGPMERNDTQKAKFAVSSSEFKESLNHAMAISSAAECNVYELDDSVFLLSP